MSSKLTPRLPPKQDAGCMRSVFRHCAAGAVRWIRAAPRAVDAAQFPGRSFAGSPAFNVLIGGNSSVRTLASIGRFEAPVATTGLSRAAASHVLGLRVGNFCANLPASLSGSRFFSAEAAEAGPDSSQPSRFAIVGIGGKQYKVVEGDRITTERLIGKDVGTTVVFDSVMMVGDRTTTKVGQPFVAGSTVEAVVEQQTRAPKVFIYKKRRRKNSQRFKGFRAAVTSLRIKVINSA